MNVGSCFSGVGGFDLGFERAGMHIVWQCEIDPYRRRVLRRHWLDTPCFTDVREVGGDAGSVDLLCGGFPCQDLSIAGQRAGLAGERSGLFFEFARVADAVLRPGGWVVIENVPGLLSSHGGRDFALVLATLADLGFHDLAWRVLDSRYFGVPQRRRRVYIVGRRASGRRACEVLLEPESGGGDFASGRETRARVAASLSRGSSSAGVSAPGRRQEDDENLVGVLGSGSSSTRLNFDGTYVGVLDGSTGGLDDNDARNGRIVGPLMQGGRFDDAEIGGGHFVAHTLTSDGFDASEDGTGRGTPLVADLAPRDNRDARADVAGADERGAGRDRGSEGDGGLDRAPADGDGMRAPAGLSRRMDGGEPVTFDWQAGGSGDESWRGKSRQWIDHKPGETAALQTTKTWAALRARTGQRAQSTPSPMARATQRWVTLSR